MGGVPAAYNTTHQINYKKTFFRYLIHIFSHFDEV